MPCIRSRLQIAVAFCLHLAPVPIVAQATSLEQFYEGLDTFANGSMSHLTESLDNGTHEITRWGLLGPPNVTRGRSLTSDPMCINGKLLPQLFLLGSQKCSTTSLCKQLQTQARMKDGRSKETHYFDKHYGPPNINEYAGKFGACGNSAVGYDGTPNYVLHYCRSRALGYIKSMYGSERLRKTTFAMILCDPVQRAQSFEYHLGCHGCFKSHAANPSDRQSSIGDGKYADQIKDILRYFGQVAIIPAVIYWGQADLVLRECLILSKGAQASDHLAIH